MGVEIVGQSERKQAKLIFVRGVELNLMEGITVNLIIAMTGIKHQLLGLDHH